MSVDVMAEPVEQLGYPSRERFRASRKRQRAERRRRFVAVPLVLIGLGMVGAGVYKVVTNESDPEIVTPQVGGVEQTNTSTSLLDPTSTLDTSGVINESIPTIPPVSDPIDTTAAPTSEPSVSIIPPKTLTKPKATVKKSTTSKTTVKKSTTTVASASTTAP